MKAPTVKFETSLQHLMAELERIDLRVRLQVMRVRAGAGQNADDEFRGLYISEEEIDSLLAHDGCSRDQDDRAHIADSPPAKRLLHLETEIAAWTQESLAHGIELRLCRLSDRFGLNRFEIDTLLICLLPEIHTRYERLYAYLHDDVTRKRPSVDLALQCLVDDPEERLRCRESFLAPGPLIEHHLLRVEDESGSRPSPLPRRTLKIDDRIAGYLLDSDEPDSALSGYVRLIDPATGLADLITTGPLRQTLTTLARNLAGGSTPILYLQGPAGVGKRTTVEALCNAGGWRLMTVDVQSLLARETSPETLVALAVREASLQDRAICWHRFDLLLSEDIAHPRLLGDIAGQIQQSGHPTFLTGEGNCQPGNLFGSKAFVQIELDLPPHAVRRSLWETYLNGTAPPTNEIDIDDISEKFRFTPAQIRDAASTARNMSLHDGRQNGMTAEHLYAACRAVSSQKLALLARKIQPRFTWTDIVLPIDQMAQLREIANYVRYRHIVYADWNFDTKVSLGKGLNVLFAGPSGTGKTMAADILAHELELDLYKIDLSTVVSKYIGETEKNLDRIFREAHNSNAILFFDEADAVFGKRSEVRDSHDRYANIEVAYLLQKMEEYDGIVILATNLRKNIDDAFARRMHFSVEFPQPDEPDRLRIWKSIFPAEAPVDESVDLNFMARQFKITGGNIKNIAVGAAFLAAADGGCIRMEHLIRATKREFQKVGRLCNETDFGDYFNFVNGNAREESTESPR